MTQPPFEPPTGRAGACALSGHHPGSVAVKPGNYRGARYHTATRVRPRRMRARATRLRLAWVLAFTALTVALTAAAVPASPANALTVPHAVTAFPAHDPASGWVSTTDPTSGISVMLPGQPTVDKTTGTVDGKSVPVRTYKYKLSKINGVVAFTALDFPPGTDLSNLDRFTDGFKQSFESTSRSKVTITDNRRFDLDGHPAIDVSFTFTTNDKSGVGFVRTVSQGNHIVSITTIGATGKENTLTQLHQRVVGTLQLSGTPR